MGATVFESAVVGGGAAARAPGAAPPTPAAVAELLRSLPGELRAEVAALDLARAGRALGYLEGWWTALRGQDAEPPSPGASLSRLEAIVGAGILRALRDDAAVVRLILEARAVGELFAECAPEAAEVRGRAERLEATASEYVIGLLGRRADAAWDEVLAARRRE
jgi:hypothetical protein